MTRSATAAVLGKRRKPVRVGFILSHLGALELLPERRRRGGMNSLGGG